MKLLSVLFMQIAREKACGLLAMAAIMLFSVASTAVAAVTCTDNYCKEDVTVAYQGGGQKNAVIYAPDPMDDGPYPGIATVPPAFDRPNESMEWIVKHLAQEGYVIIMVENNSFFGITQRHLAAMSGIDFFESTNPVFDDVLINELVDTNKIGLLGYSLGARTIAWTQEADTRVEAFVALDNFAKHEDGDDGSSSCKWNNASPRTPQAKGLGLASDTDPCLLAKGANAKKDAYDHWSGNQIEAMQLAFEGWAHLDFAEGAPQEKREIIQYYTLAWFDHWLKAKPDAKDRLLANTVEGSALDELLDSHFLSAAFFDGVDCSDLVNCPDLVD